MITRRGLLGMLFVAPIAKALAVPSRGDGAMAPTEVFDGYIRDHVSVCKFYGAEPIIPLADAQLLRAAGVDVPLPLVKELAINDGMQECVDAIGRLVKALETIPDRRTEWYRPYVRRA